jgi:hypothetical protein
VGQVSLLVIGQTLRFAGNNKFTQVIVMGQGNYPGFLVQVCRLKLKDGRWFAGSVRSARQAEADTG